MKLTWKQLKIEIVFLIFKEKIPARITQIQIKELRKQSSDS